MPDHTTITNQVDGNVMIGTNIALVITGGDENVIVGTNACPAITTGRQNVILGYDACDDMTSGDMNVVIGDQAAALLLTGNNNTIVGQLAGGTLTTGADNIVIGKDADVDIAARSNGMFLPTSLTVNPTGASAAGDTYVSFQSTTGRLTLSQGPSSFRQIAIATGTFSGAVQNTATLAHGLGRIPDLYGGRMVALTVNNGYSIGDEITISTAGDNNSAIFTFTADGTNIYASWRPFQLIIRSGTAEFQPVAGEFDLYLVAFCF
jgi:hypothetical protein